MLKREPDARPVGRVPAVEIEAAVIDQLRGVFRQPEIIVGTWRAARAEQDDMTEDEAREALIQLVPEAAIHIWQVDWPQSRRSLCWSALVRP